MPKHVLPKKDTDNQPSKVARNDESSSSATPEFDFQPEFNEQDYLLAAEKGDIDTFNYYTWLLANQNTDTVSAKIARELKALERAAKHGHTALVAKLFSPRRGADHIEALVKEGTVSSIIAGLEYTRKECDVDLELQWRNIFGSLAKFNRLDAINAILASPNLQPMLQRVGDEGFGIGFHIAANTNKLDLFKVLYSRVDVKQRQQAYATALKSNAADVLEFLKTAPNNGLDIPGIKKTFRDMEAKLGSTYRGDVTLLKELFAQIDQSSSKLVFNFSRKPTPENSGTTPVVAKPKKTLSERRSKV